MRMLWTMALLFVTAIGFADDSKYKLGEDSMPQEGVPKGTVTAGVLKSKVFEGTIRQYWVYVPKQYDGSKPASVTRRVEPSASTEMYLVPGVEAAEVGGNSVAICPVAS